MNAYRRKHLKAYPVVEAVAVAFVSAFVGYTNVFSRVSMSELVSNLFRECTPQTPDFHGLCEYFFQSWLKSNIAVVEIVT